MTPDHEQPDGASVLPSGGVPEANDFLIVTGMSGAGRSTAANVIEDRGWFIVDNLPPGLWPTGTATWTAISNNGVPSGSECGLLCVFHNSHSMWWPAVRT